MNYKNWLQFFSPEILQKRVDNIWIFNSSYDYVRWDYVDLVSIDDASARVVVKSRKGRQHVEFKLQDQTLSVTCTCGENQERTWCSDAVAAGIKVYEYCMTLYQNSWQYQLRRLAEAHAQPDKKRNPYWLFVGLSMDESQAYLQPYRFWFQKLPGDILPMDQPLTAQTLADLVSHNPWMSEYIKVFRKGDDLLGCVNVPEDAYRTVRILQTAQTLVSQPYAYYGYSQKSLYDFGLLLDMVLDAHIPLLLVDDSRTWHVTALRCLTDAEPVIRLTRLPDNSVDVVTTWYGRDESGEIVEITSDATEFIVLNKEQPMWALAGDLLVRFSETIAGLDDVVLGGLHFRVDESEMDECAEIVSTLVAAGGKLVAEGSTNVHIQSDFVPRLYLKEEHGKFLAKLYFTYQGYEFPYVNAYIDESVRFDPETWQIVRITRQPEKESALYREICSARGGLKRTTKKHADHVLALRATVDVVDFLLKKVPFLLETGFEIYGEENLKSVRINRNAPSISLNITSGIDWFDLQAAVKFGDTPVEWKTIRQAIRKRERFVKLADGSIGEIPEAWMQRYRRLFGVAEETTNGLRMGDQQVVLLDQLLEDLDEFHVDDEFQRRRERLRNFANIKEVPLPQGFVGELRPYQQAGYHWLHFLHDYGFGGCLADDMGLGKTVQVLAFLLSLRESSHAQAPDLIVVPRSLLVNWQREAQRFTPSLKVTLHFGQTRTKEQPDFSPYDLVITTYGTMLRDSKILREQRFHYIVLDESQVVKNPLAKTSRAVRRLNSDHRLVMTGTPVENTTFELWSQFAFLNPGLLGSLEYFKEEFGTPIEKKQDQSASEFLRRMVYPFILRRTKDQVAPELPPRVERTIYCDMDAAQKKFYLHTRDYYRAQLLGMLDEQGVDNARMKILEGLLRLRQICNHPKLVREDFRGDSAKMETILEHLETLHSEGHKALVFSQFVQMLTLLRHELEARGIPYEYLDGSTTNRQAHVDRFQSDAHIPFFLISLKAGGVGLNLTAADYVLHVDPWWNPAVEIQATDRAHRIGQDKPVFVYKFITRDSIEEKVLLLQERKKELVEQLVSTEGSFFKNLTANDVELLFSV
ncbi:MAG: hypothetical protein Fur0018_17570 [Anaerolineales bacterium]